MIKTQIVITIRLKVNVKYRVKRAYNRKRKRIATW
jgi:hypothetical protein